MNELFVSHRLRFKRGPQPAIAGLILLAGGFSGPALHSSRRICFRPH